MGILSIILVCIWEIVCPNPCSCLYKSMFPSSLVSSWLVKLTSGGGRPYRISNGENPIPARGKLLTLRGPQATCLPKISLSPGIVLLVFVWGFDSRIPLSLSPGDGRQHAISTGFSKPLPSVVLCQLQMPVHCPTLWSEAFHIWGQCLSGVLWLLVLLFQFG